MTLKYGKGLNIGSEIDGVEVSVNLTVNQLTRAEKIENVKNCVGYTPLISDPRLNSDLEKEIDSWDESQLIQSKT